MRKSALVALVSSGLVVLSGVTGRAGTLWDIDLIGKNISSKTPYIDYFEAPKGKYNPALEKVTSAQVWFSVLDDEMWNPKDKNEKVAIDLGSKPFLGPYNAYFNPFFGGEISGDDLATLDKYGALKYTIRSYEGDFWAAFAKLYVETSPRAVPDGGATLMLLGVALAGIESLRRRMAKRNLRQRRA
jgi:hypothetical protein